MSAKKKTLSDSELHEIKQAQLKNILQKVKDGKGLTQTEQRLVQEFKEGDILGTVPTLIQAARKLGASVAEVIAARKAGSPGFRSGRINCDKVKAWMDANPAALKDSMTRMERAKLKRAEAEADMKRFKADVLKGQYLLKSAVENTVARTLGGARSLLQQKLEREYPAAVAGLSVVEARIKGKQLFDDICAELRKLEQPWTV